MRSFALGLVALASTAASAVELTPGQIDQLLAAEWKKAHLKPAPITDDARFLRRVWLDLAGTLPPPDAVTAFLDDKRADKRARLVDTLLAAPSYADHFTNVWEKLWIGRQAKGALADHAAFRLWLHDQLARDVAWDQVTHTLLTATGQTDEAGATNFFVRYARTPADLSGKVARTFLGVQIQCAQCHDHPTEAWKRDDFRKLAACFVRTAAQPLDQKKVMGVKRFAVRDFPIAVAGLRGKMMADPDLAAIETARPTALDGTDFTLAANPRQALADWIVAPANPWFARAQVNRVWAMLLGRGFVEPVDDFRRGNPPVAPRVLDALAADFVQHHYDLQRLIRVITATRAYQTAAAPPRAGTAADAERLWARYGLRPLGADELYDALLGATHVEPVFQRFAGARFEKQKLQLHNVLAFLFDVDEEVEPGEFEGTVPQALLLLNGPLVNAGSSALPGTAVADVLALDASDEAKITQLYLRTLSRRPTKAELERWTTFVHARTPMSQAYEDLMWALLNASEFQLKH
jgi:hypothetical protein